MCLHIHNCEGWHRDVQSSRGCQGGSLVTTRSHLQYYFSCGLQCVIRTSFITDVCGSICCNLSVLHWVWEPRNHVYPGSQREKEKCPSKPKETLSLGMSLPFILARIMALKKKKKLACFCKEYNIKGGNFWSSECLF